MAPPHHEGRGRRASPTCLVRAGRERERGGGGQEEGGREGEGGGVGGTGGRVVHVHLLQYSTCEVHEASY